MPELALDKAVELTRTGDVWVFRGASLADRAIRALTNAPVNHVGMAVVLEDMPPLLWHAELGRSLPDAWTGEHQRGVQLHDLRDAVTTWRRRYGQRAWLRQLVGPAEDGGVTPEMEDAVLRTIARLDGKPFPTTRGLVARLGQRPAAAAARRRDGVLRRARGGDLHRHGAAAGRPAAQRLRPGQLLVRRRPRAAAGRASSARRSRSTSRRRLTWASAAPGRSTAPCRPGRSACARAPAGCRPASSPNGVCPVPMSTGTRDSVRSAISPARRKACTVRPPSTYTRRYPAALERGHRLVERAVHGDPGIGARRPASC